MLQWAEFARWQSIRRSKQLTALLAVVLATQIIAAVLDFQGKALSCLKRLPVSLTKGRRFRGNFGFT